MQWLVNTSLLKVICRGVWLCTLTYPVIYRLTLNKSDLQQRSKIIFSLSSKGSHLSNDNMITVLSANFAQSVQLKLNSELNYQVEPKTNKGKSKAKRHKVMPTIQQTRYNRRNKVWLAQRLWTESKLCKEHN